MNKFDYEGALQAGYSEQEINDFLSNQPKYETYDKGDSAFTRIGKNFRNFTNNFSNPTGRKFEPEGPQVNQRLLKKVPNFDVEAALEAGYSPDEINEFLSDNMPKRSFGEKAGRIGAQYGLGLLEASPAGMAYDIGVAPLASKEAQNIPYREMLGDELEHLMEKKAMGHWDEQDQADYDRIAEQLQDPKKSMEFAQSADIGIRGLAEKATGIDLHPEGIAEKAANWAAFVKDPVKVKEAFKYGLSIPQITKAIMPGGKEILRGLTAGTALEMAEQGNMGPIGMMAAAVVGDLIGHGAGEGISKSIEFVKNPKKALAETAASFTSKEKKLVQEQIIKDFREAGIQADIGTITDSNLLKWMQSRLAQSGLTGKALDDFRKELTQQITSEYQKIANSLGEARFSTNYEAGSIAKESIKSIRDAEKREISDLYNQARKSLKKDSHVESRRLADAIAKLEKGLKPGNLKSVEQKAVLETIEKLKRDIYDTSGNLMYASVEDLMNNKVALGDIINYEVQGGAKQLLKDIVSEIDRSIISHGKTNPTFAKSYINANKAFSKHAKIFRNKDVNRLLKDVDPSQLMNRMNSIHGMKQLESIFNKTPEGTRIFNGLKRLKFDQAIGNNLIDSTTQQAKLGTFSKLLEKKNNREIVKEILGKDSYRRLERLQKNASKLAEASEKFYNASKSGAMVTDAAILAKGMNDVASVLMGNPWPLAKTVGGVLGARKISQLLADPEFLKLTEEAILSTGKTEKQLINSFERLRPYILTYLNNEND